MKTMSLRVTDALHAAVKKTAHLEETTVQQVLETAIVQKLERIHHPKVEELLAAHLATTEGTEEESHG